MFASIVRLSCSTAALAVALLVTAPADAQYYRGPDYQYYRGPYYWDDNPYDGAFYDEYETYGVPSYDSDAYRVFYDPFEIDDPDRFDDYGDLFGDYDDYYGHYNWGVYDTGLGDDYMLLDNQYGIYDGDLSAQNLRRPGPGLAGRPLRTAPFWDEYERPHYNWFEGYDDTGEEGLFDW